MMQRRHFSHLVNAILVALICSDHGVESKKHKKTRQPSSSPSFAPSTSFPSASPSFQPTQWPSNKPTKKPTLRPTVSPTELPTPQPTAPLTRKPTAPPTNTPTELPTSIPTWNSSQSPSRGALTTQPTIEVTSKWDPSEFPSRWSPTANPTKEVVVTPSPTNQPSKPANGRDIPVPRIQMALILSENDMIASRNSIQTHMSNFITVLFETKSGIEALDMVSLELELVPSTFVKQSVEYGFSIKIEGMLQNTYGDITKEVVKEKVVEYFSSVGVNDLETFLHGKSITSATVGELYIDGIVVFMRKDDENNSAETRNTSELSSKRRGLFAILAGAAGVLLVSCSIFFYRRNYSTESESASSVPYQSLLAKLRRNGSISEHHTDSESHNSEREISVHLSMDELQPGVLQYDPARLDRIIDLAKSHGKKKGWGSNALRNS